MKGKNQEFHQLLLLCQGKPSPQVTVLQFSYINSKTPFASC